MDRAGHLTHWNGNGTLDNATAATVSGLIASAAYAAVLEADLRLTGRNVDDLSVLGRFFVSDHPSARRIGLGFHLVNSVGLALLYARFRASLPGPPWLRGVLFALAENALLYPITLLEDKHPGIRDGSIARYWNWPAFIQSIPRHIAYGAVLGLLDHKLRHQPRPQGR